VERNGEVWLHRPYTRDPTFKSLHPSEASVVYRRILETVTDYLDEMEVPRPMIDMMVGTGSSELRRVEDDDGLRHPPSFAEWAHASCGSFTAEERKTWYDLSTRPRDSLTLQEQRLLRRVYDKLQETNRCMMLLLHTQRDRLAPP
jgi:hypothetical protein